jgi:GntR family transcriptional regulator
MQINREFSTPLYFQLKQILLEMISSQNLGPGDRLPTEEELQKTYTLSRTTVRRALHELELEGRVKRIRRRGTIVSQPQIVHRPELSYHPFNDHLATSSSLGWRVLFSGTVAAPPDVASRLKIETGVETFHLKRLHMVEDEIIGYHEAYVSPHFNEAIEESQMTESGTLTYLDGGGHLNGSLADRVIQAVAADKQLSDLLQIEVGTPLIKVNRLVFDQEEKPIEDLVAYFRGDRFLYRVSNLPSVIWPDLRSVKRD